jgi:undecaprenyl-diphosphatase
MNDYALALILGVIEGLTEFLPVSSTAHLRIAESLLGMDLADGYWKMFSIAIQLGAILCLPIYFRSRIAALLRSFPHGSRGDRTAATHPLTLTFAAFACTAVPALLLSKVIGTNLENIKVMAGALILGGVAMWAVDARCGGRSSGDVEQIRPGQAIWIGLCQTLSAVFPGTTRSMATIASGQIAGLSRATALEFSFLLSMPTMAAAAAYDVFKFIRNPDAGGGAALNLHGTAVLAVGFVVSFVVAWGVVAWFMAWVRRRSLAAFAVYRILAGVAVLLWASR